MKVKIRCVTVTYDADLDVLGFEKDFEYEENRSEIEGQPDDYFFRLARLNTEGYKIEYKDYGYFFYSKKTNLRMKKLFIDSIN